jgi:hypothetical protein
VLVSASVGGRCLLALKCPAVLCELCVVYAHKVRVIFAIGRRHVVLPWGGHGGACPTRQLSELWVLLAELRNNCWVGGG